MFISKKPKYKYKEDIIKNNKSGFSEMDTQVHNTWPLTCAQHKNFINISEIKQNQVTIYWNLSENSTKVR